MAISTYAELQDSIVRWLDRSDLSDIVPDFIKIAESQIKREVRLLEIETTSSTITDASEKIELPDGFNGMKELYIDGDPKRLLEQITLTTLRASNLGVGKPAFYAIADSSIYLAPIPDSAYSLVATYYKFEPLSDTVTTNGVLTEYPDIYLYLSLAAAEGYLVNDSRVAMWKQLAQSAIKESVIHKDRKVFGGKPLRIITG